MCVSIQSLYTMYTNCPIVCQSCRLYSSGCLLLVYYIDIQCYSLLSNIQVADIQDNTQIYRVIHAHIQETFSYTGTQLENIQIGKCIWLIICKYVGPTNRKSMQYRPYFVHEIYFMDDIWSMHF